jgi:hypothetical protein
VGWDCTNTKVDVRRKLPTINYTKVTPCQEPAVFNRGFQTF